jgi:hypothetical protein
MYACEGGCVRSYVCAEGNPVPGTRARRLRCKRCTSDPSTYSLPTGRIIGRADTLRCAMHIKSAHTCGLPVCLHTRGRAFTKGPSYSTDLPKLDHLRFPGLRATFGGARPALRGPLGPNRPWPEGDVAGGLVRAVLGVVQNDWAP